MSLVEDGNVSDTLMNSWINNQLLLVGVMEDDWAFLANTATLGVVAAQRTVALPTDFEYGLKLMDTVEDTPLQRVSSEYGLSRLMDDDTTGDRPYKFWLWNAQTYLWPLPSTTQAGRLTLYYYNTIPVLSDDVTQIVFNPAFHETIVYGVLGVLYEREEYYDQADKAFLRRDILVSRMSRWYRNNFTDSPQIMGDGVSAGFRQTDPNLGFLDGV